MYFLMDESSGCFVRPSPYIREASGFKQLVIYRKETFAKLTVKMAFTHSKYNTPKELINPIRGRSAKNGTYC